MITDSEKMLKVITLAKIKGTIATLVWEMQLENFNAVILDVVAEELYTKLDKIIDPTDLNCAKWLTALDKECEHFISHDTVPALSILPWFDKIDFQLIAAYAFGGSRHTVMHVVSTVGLIKNKINTGSTLSKIASPGNMDGSLPWFIVAKEIVKLERLVDVGPMKVVQQEARIVELLNIAVGYEVEVMNR